MYSNQKAHKGVILFTDKRRCIPAINEDTDTRYNPLNVKALLRLYINRHVSTDIPKIS